MPETRVYRMGPFLLASELHLPELPLQQPGPSPDVAVRLGPVPERLSQPLFASPAQEGNREEYLLRIPGVAQYYVRGAREVVIQPQTEAPAVDVRAFLLGALFAVLCLQRGLLPLHASAVAMRRGAVAFLGDSGAGKSSLAAFLAQRGHRVIADDICLLDPDAGSHSRVIPVAPWLKLWRETLQILDQPADELSPVFSTEDKYRLHLDEDAGRLGLAAVVFLERAENAGPASASLDRLGPAQTLQKVMQYTFRRSLIEHTGQSALLFERCGRALDGAEAWVLMRPWGFDRMDEVLRMLEYRFDSSVG